ncbi:MAG: M1 family metallopeptidase, partial [Actinomycetota bacterium]|nr:M1 family metallopeptidase [Actinomycetota bacterium]
ALTACSFGGSGPSTVPPSPTVGRPAVSQVEVVRNPADPDYTVRLRGDATGRTWTGWEEVSFSNTDVDPLGRVWLRLWSNGLDGCDPMAITISRPSSGSWSAPTTDCTAVPIDLDTPLAPGARTSLRFDLRIRVPARNDRFGYAEGMTLLGTPLPTLAVHDDRGWHLDPFVRFGESFYSIVGRYRVTLDVPGGLATPTTGQQVGLTRDGAREIRTFAADDVRDFAWAAGEFRVLQARAGDDLIRVWYRPEVVPPADARDMLQVARTSMATYASVFGDYPYPEVDVVLTDFKRYGGMEYPQIVFANPEDRAVTHELAHQWWYGIVGNDEYAEPWLDEAFATWSMFLPLRPWRACDRYRWPSPTARITSDMSYWSDHTKEYGTIYGGGGCMLADLAHRFGISRFEAILAGYAHAHRFGIVRGGDFTAAVDRAASTRLPDLDMPAFWTRWRVG